jgi:tRNA-dihydrouridine synthase B
MNRLPDADAVLRLLDSFYDPLIARGVTRRLSVQHEPTDADDAAIAEAA